MAPSDFVSTPSLAAAARATLLRTRPSTKGAKTRRSARHKSSVVMNAGTNFSPATGAASVGADRGSTGGGNTGGGNTGGGNTGGGPAAIGAGGVTGPAIGCGFAPAGKPC